MTAVSLGVSAAVTAGMLHSCKAIEEHNKLAIAGAVLSTAFTGGKGSRGNSREGAQTAHKLWAARAAHCRMGDQR